MKRNFFYFAWRELTRSANLNKNVAAKGVLIFLAVYFSAVALFMGFNLSTQLAESNPKNVISAFNALIFVYVGFELVLRIMIQNLPTFGFQPFLIVPVKRKRIARYMLNKSLLHFFNILPLFLILPFALKTAIYELETPAFTAWLVSLFFMIFSLKINVFIVFH